MDLRVPDVLLRFIDSERGERSRQQYILDCVNVVRMMKGVEAFEPRQSKKAD